MRKNPLNRLIQGTSFWQVKPKTVLNIYDPKIHVRIHKGFPEDIFEKLLDMIRRGHSSICLLNDEIIIPGMMRIGVTAHDAAQYVALGCYEPIVMVMAIKKFF